ncbi:hypothetical protein BRC92_10925 [Halobacteriales archaeon QS_4_69_31]|nr:MAG: hypothetical protein BRC92_10925 [Halobacteriales archaeon QS_4_69_31]
MPTCDGCGEDVSIAGGIGGFWSSDADASGGMTLELTDGSEHFLCHDCMDRLPDDYEPTAADVADL